jgi:hypothetical protein
MSLPASKAGLCLLSQLPDTRVCLLSPPVSHSGLSILRAVTFDSCPVIRWKVLKDDLKECPHTLAAVGPLYGMPLRC